MRHDAHRLLGSARTLSLSTFERLWLRIEELASSHQEIPPATVDEVRRACVELESWIERHLSPGPTTFALRGYGGQEGTRPT